MKLINQFKAQVNNIFRYKTITLPKFVKRFFTLPFDYYLRNGKSCYPTNITFEITFNCNMNCKMCYLKNIRNKYKDLPTNEIKKLIKNISFFKPSISLIGGEPLLRKDIIEIVSYIKCKGLSCGITTNAYLLNKKISKELVKLNINYINFSLDGPKEIHDKIRGVNGSFDKVIQNIKYFNKIKSKEITTRINCTISKDNIDHLDKMVNITKDLGVNYICFNHITFITKEESNKNKLFWKNYLSKYPYKTEFFVGTPINENILDNIKKLRDKAKKLKVKVAFQPELSNKQINQWYKGNYKNKGKCIYPWGVMRIAPNGDIYPCLAYFIRIGNIKNEKIKLLWNDLKYQKFRRLIKRKKILPACNRCCRL